MSGLTIRPNKTTGKLELSPESNEAGNSSRVIDSYESTIATAQSQSITNKWITLTLILSFAMAFIVISISLNNIDFIGALIKFTIIAFGCYIIVNYIDYLNTKYIMDTVRAVMDKFKPKVKKNEMREVKDEKEDLNKLH